MDAPSPAPRPVLMVEVVGRGGIADYTRELAAALAAAGRPVVVATARDHLYRPAPGVALRGTFGWVRGTSPVGRAVRRAGLGPAVNAARFAAALPGVLRTARRRAGLVHVQSGYFPPLLALLAVLVRAAGLPLVFTAHGTFDRGRSHGWAHRVIGACARTTIVHTRADVGRLPPAAGRRAAIVPHGEYGALARTGGAVDRDAARRALGIPAAAVVALLFGQLRADKGIGDLLTAAADVPGLHVLVAGEDVGGLAAARSALAAPALAGRVTVDEGFHPMRVAAAHFAAADVVVLPYRVASQSGVLLLAYGFARPVVAYPVGGLPEAVEHGTTGWLCARPDAAALAETLRDVVAAGPAECSRRGAAGEAMAAQRWSWPAVARATAGVYDGSYRPASRERTAVE